MSEDYKRVILEVIASEGKAIPDRVTTLLEMSTTPMGGFTVLRKYSPPREIFPELIELMQKTEAFTFNVVLSRI